MRRLLNEIRASEWLTALGLSLACASAGITFVYQGHAALGLPAVALGAASAIAATIAYAAHLRVIAQEQQIDRGTDASTETKPIVLGMGMMHFEVQDLSRKGSYDRIPQDVVAFLRELESFEASGHAATFDNTLTGEPLLGRRDYEVRKLAEDAGLIQTNLDHMRAPAWSFALTIKGHRLLDALKAPWAAR